MKTIIGLCVSCFIVGFLARAQSTGSNTEQEKDPFLVTVEQSLQLFYNDYKTDLSYDSIINALNYEQNEIPQFSDSVICARIAQMNELTPFQLECNEYTLKTIRFFETNRRSFIRIALGRSALYFDMYKEKLSQYELPIELRFLSVIESALRPQIKSRAGALGLWQFMYRTGLHYGLEENSFIDERMDPELATDAACRMLKKLYGMYGDWNLSLAAYNAGPGNVNKAIRRSGNKKTYWEVRPFLPRETQGYVPNFIAAAYLMTYHAEHNIIPMEAKVHNIELDTICFTKGLHMNTIAQLLSWDVDSIKEFNPVFKSDYMPKEDHKKRCFTAPFHHITTLAGLEDSLYYLEDSLYNRSTTQNTNQQEEISSNSTYYTVKSGDNLKDIASQYNVTVDDLLTWNGLNSTVINVGQRLKIKGSSSQTSTTSTTTSQSSKKYHTVRSGDTLGGIAQRYNTTVSTLQRLNPRVNPRRMQIGQKIRVR